jgi:anti-sigma regulatory factor (Ser/Thr protein kinase)
MRSNATTAKASKGDGPALKALAAEVARLRAENAELVALMGKREGAKDGALDSFEVTVRLGPGAPANAREAVTSWLSGIVPDHVRDDARLLISELVTNALHAGLAADTPVWISGRLTHSVVWLQVGNPGRAGAISQRDPAPRIDGGSGLQLVEMVAARWGVNRSADTRVWFELLAA